MRESGLCASPRFDTKRNVSFSATHPARLAWPDETVNSLGARLPKALCGRSSLQCRRQASTFALALSRLRNQLAFRHLARNRLGVQTLGTQSTIECFNQAIIRGFTTPAKIQLHFPQIRPLSQSLARELGAVVHANPFGQASHDTNAIQNRCHLWSAKELAHLDRKTLTSKVIDYRQQTKPPLIE
jgi:hypothetical protein